MAKSFPAVTLLLAGLLAASCARLPAPSPTPTATRTPEPSLTPSCAPSATPEPTAEPPDVATRAPTPAPCNVALVGHIGGEDSSMVVLPSPNPVIVPGEAWAVAVADGYAYVSQGSDWPSSAAWGGFAVVDLADLSRPSVVGSHEFPRPAVRAAVLGKTLYVTDGLCEFGPARCSGALHILDISTPASPVRIGSYELDGIPSREAWDTTWYASDVALAGDYAYVTGGAYRDASLECGLRVVQVSDPARLAVAGVIKCEEEGTNWKGHGVVVAGDYAYVAAGDAGVRVVNVANPSAPVETGHAELPGTARDLDVVGHYAYVAADEAGVQVVDVSDPARPVVVGAFDAAAPTQSVAVAGGYAYVAAGKAGLRVLDISDPTHPREVGFYVTPGWVNGVTLADGYIFVADVEQGLYVLQFLPAAGSAS